MNKKEMKKGVLDYIIEALNTNPEHILEIGGEEYNAEFKQDGELHLTCGREGLDLVFVINIRSHDDDTELARLFDVTNDEEANMLQELGVKAGLLKKCPECHYFIDQDAKQCPDCGKSFPPDEPPSESVKKEYLSKIFNTMKDAANEGCNVEELFTQARDRLVNELWKKDNEPGEDG
jgi:hypothetical protein